MSVNARTRAVIFDLDGTLLDTEALYLSAAQQVCAGYGAEYTLELKRSLMGGDTLTGARKVAATLGLPIDALEYLAQRERILAGLWPNALPMPGALALVRSLQERSVAMAIATSGHDRITRLKLQPHTFHAEMALILCGDDVRVARGKPAPDIFLCAARELGIPPEACAVIEDSPQGVRAGLAAGMHTVALVDRRWGHALDAFEGAAHRVHSLEELTLEMLGV